MSDVCVGVCVCARASETDPISISTNSADARLPTYLLELITQTDFEGASLSVFLLHSLHGTNIRHMP